MPAPSSQQHAAACLSYSERGDHDKRKAKQCPPSKHLQKWLGDKVSHMAMTLSAHCCAVMNRQNFLRGKRTS